MTRRRKILRGFLLLFGLGFTYMVVQLFWPSPRIVVSKETTWLTEPLAEDGLPDYAAYLLEQGSEGVTPENNGAVPYLQAMWPAGLESRHQEPLCEYLGMRTPDRSGMFNPLENEEFQARARAWLEEQTRDAEPEEEETQSPDVVAEEGGEETAEEFEEGDIEFDDEWVEDPLVDEPSVSERMEELFEAVENRPWRREECAPLAEWIDEHAPEYELLHEAVRRPRFYLPSPSHIVDPGDVLVYAETPALGMRDAARCLALRGFLSLGEGDVAAAWKDCEAMYRLAAQVPDDSLVALLVGTGIESYARDFYLSLLESPHFTPEVAREMVGFHLERRKGRNLDLAIEPYERLSFLSEMMVLAKARRGGAKYEAEFGDNSPAGLAIRVGVDWNTSMRMGNDWIDKLTEVAQMPDRSARTTALDAWSDDMYRLKAKFPMNIPGAIVSRGARNRVMGEFMVGLLLPALEAPFYSEDRSAAFAHLDPVAAALAVYRLERGEYPESLEQLVPDILSAPPIDSYGNPVAYRRTENGYLVYSTGPNGRDDGGSQEFIAHFEGYLVERDNEELARVVLGLPPVDEDAAEGGSAPLGKKIPRDADDWGIRLPTLNSELYKAPPAEE